MTAPDPLRPRAASRSSGEAWAGGVPGGGLTSPPPSPMEFGTARYGAFAQVSYRLADFGFGETVAPAALIHTD
ncbi:MAG: hypothetical protein CL858_29225 [Cupriavidus sp.]|nr:hypothetical protein [Methylobacterium sp.]MBU69462.1 hypothetical protein [Cupriavidus sp.]RUP11844.1 MAG: hypothetical protein EKK43_24315 [Methylobacterium sp.]